MMEINPFILALSKTLPESCLQGLVVYLLLQLYFFIDKRSTPVIKFNLFYAANLCLFVGFVLTFFHHYQQINVSQFDTNLLQKISRNNNLSIVSKPNLWLQFNFWTNHYAYLITGFYLIGLLYCILKLTIGLINVNWFRSNKNLKLDDRLTQLSIQLSSNFRLIKTVSVFVCDQIFVPLTLGFIKPIIVVPIALINQLSAAQTEAILLHELAHIKRNDYLLNILLCIVQSFLFFNPAIWLMKREINKYREQCCDDLVLNNTSHKIAYARALLLIEESRNTQLTLALASNGKKYTLLNRIKRITNMKTNQPSPQNKFVVSLLALSLVGLTVAWNIPVKKAIKHFANQHFKAIEEARDSDRVTVVSDKIVKHRLNKPGTLTITGNRINFDATADTIISSLGKIKIVLEDSLGNKKEYNSIDELPAEDQKDFLKQNEKSNILNDVSFSLKFPDLTKYTYHSKYRDSNDLKIKTDEMVSIAKMQIADYKKQINSPEYKKKFEEMVKQFDSPEYKKKMLDMVKQFDSPEYKKKMDEMIKQFDSPEYKKKIASMAKQYDSPEFKKKMDEMVKQFDSPEYKKKMAEMLKYYSSPEWKRYERKMLNINLTPDTVITQKVIQKRKN